MFNRAYSLLEIKRVDVAQRVVEGIATTPSVDRGGDSMDPAGAVFSLPLPFLWHHGDPIGEVFEADVRPDGIHIKARVSRVADDAPASLKARVDEAWASFTAQPPLVRGLSVGWKELEGAPIKGTRFRRIARWIWGELSAVVVPMNMHASITAVKSLDTMAASGRHPLRVGSLPVVHTHEGKSMKTVQEQIKAFEATRASKAARMTELMTKAAEADSTLDADQTVEYDEAALELKSIDAHLVRLHDLEKTNLTTATAITGATDAEKAAALRGGTPIIQVKSMLPPGYGMARAVMALVQAKGNGLLAERIAQTRWKDQPEVELFLKAAVAPGTTTDATWAAPLVPAVQTLTSEFLELLRPATILGKLNLRRVPFDVSVNAQTLAGTYGWVGETKPKPVTKLGFGNVTIGHAKIAGIVVISDELAKRTNAEETIRQDMIEGVAGFMDAQLIDPALADVPTVSPASITNGTVAIASAGVTPDFARTDLKALIASFVAANLSTKNAVFIMSETNAFALGVALNPLGQPLFPGLGATGGVALGIPVVTSQAAGSMVILVDQRGILFASDDQVSIDVSNQASVEMDSAPTDPVVGATVLVSLWQHNLTGLRVEQACAWKRARLASVKYISGAAYV